MEKYDEYMDKECIELCDAINSIPNCSTFESCCGHLKNPFKIFVRTSDEYALSILSRCFDKRYCGTHQRWYIELLTEDFGTPKFCLYIHSEDSYKDYDTMKKDCETLSENIKYWMREEFFKYFTEK